MRCPTSGRLPTNPKVIVISAGQRTIGFGVCAFGYPIRLTSVLDLPVASGQVHAGWGDGANYAVAISGSFSALGCWHGVLYRPHGMRTHRAFISEVIFICACLAGVAGCAAVFPEMQTAVHSPGPGPLDPPPGDDLYYIYFETASIPKRTSDGRPWDPDPFAKLIVNDSELLVTPIERGQRKPTWSGQTLANYRISPGDRVVVELWDDEALVDTPVCGFRINDIREFLDDRAEDITCESGARIRLHVEPARALVGVGLSYELRGSDGVQVVRVVGQSPAARAGLGAGDRILAIQGENVMAMDALGIKSKINTHARTGLELDVWFANGTRKKVTLLEGPMYPLHDDALELPQTRGAR
jgi:hypothetical protein